MMYVVYLFLLLCSAMPIVQALDPSDLSNDSTELDDSTELAETNDDQVDDTSDLTDLLSDEPTEPSSNDDLSADDPLLDTTDTEEESVDDPLSDLEDENTDEDEGEEEQGSYSPTEGADVVLPVLGACTFAPSADAITKKTASPIGLKRQKTVDDHAKNNYPIQKITIKNLIGSISSKGNLVLAGTVTINSTDGTITHTRYDASTNELTLTITYTTPFTFFILPDTEVSITSFKLLLANDRQELSAQKSIFTKDKNESKLTFGIEEKNNSGGMVTIDDQVPLISIIPSVKGNKDAEKIMLDDITISFMNPLAPEAAAASGSLMPTTTINATARLSHICLYGKAYLSDSDTTITITGPNVSFDALGNTPIVLDTDVVLNSPTISIDIAQGGGVPDIGIGGTLTTTLPVVGTINTPVHGMKSNGALELSGKLGNTIDFGPVSFGNPHIVIATQYGTSAPEPAANNTTTGSTPPATTNNDKSLRIEARGECDLFGLQIIPILRFIKPSLSAIGSVGAPQRIIEFAGEINGGKPIKPFDFIPGLNAIPGLKDFLIDKAQLGLDSTKKTFIGGSTTLLGVATQAKILTSGAKGLVASTLKPWKISDSIPELAGSILDTISFATASFAFTASNYYDAASGMMMQRGTNVFGTLDMNHGLFAPLRKMLGKALPQQITVGLLLRPNPRDIKLQAAIPLDINLSSRVSIHNLIFEVGLAPSFALMVSLRFITDAKSPPLLFTARIEFEIPFFAVSGTLEGQWHKPFGIPGLMLSNVALEIQQPYALLPPVGFGVAGTIGIGDFLAKAAVKISPLSIVLLAEVSEWPLFILPSLLRTVGLDLGPLEILKAIDIALHDVKFKFAPLGGQIGTLYFDPGISGSGKLILNIPHIIKAKLEAGFNLDWLGGFKLYAMMPNCNLGPLKLSGTGKDKKWNTADDGPIFSIILSIMQQRIFISAVAELFNSSAEIEVDIGLLHLRFKMLMKLLGFINAKIAGETYHQGWRIGYKTIGSIKVSDKAEVTLFGDINTFGCDLAGRYEALTLKDIAEMCHIPGQLVRDVGLSNLEFYIRAQG